MDFFRNRFTFFEHFDFSFMLYSVGVNNQIISQAKENNTQFLDQLKLLHTLPYGPLTTY